MRRSALVVLLIGLTRGIAPAIAAEVDPILISWRDHQITRSDYEAALRGIPERDRYEFQTSMRRITDLLNSLLLTRTLAAEAKALGLDKDPQVAKDMALAVDRLLAGKRLDSLLATLPVPDLTALAEERYRVNPEEFVEPEQARARHILIDTKTRSADLARARAEEVRAKALAGADFARLAIEYSDDKSVRDNGGELTWFGRGVMAKPFENAVFALEKPGAISAVVETQFGFHVIRLEEKMPARKKPFAEVKDVLIAHLKTKFLEKERDSYLAAIATDKSIVINGPAVDALKKEAPKVVIPPLEGSSAR